MNLNNKKAFFVFILSMAVCCAGVLNSMVVKKSTAVYMPLNNRSVVIDAGHGGWGPYFKILKKKAVFLLEKRPFFVSGKKFNDNLLKISLLLLQFHELSQLRLRF